MEISDSMVFRWVGYGIERPRSRHLPANKRKPLEDKANLTDTQIGQYLKYLQDALDPKKGLKVGPYSANDSVGSAKPSPTPFPCLFFTEQAAGTSEQHWNLYGRLGFGFSKRFIYHCGGRPVIYTPGDAKDPIVQAVEYFRQLQLKMQEKGWEDFGRHLEFLARFIKCSMLPIAQKEKAPPAKAPAKRTAKSEFQQCDYPRHYPIQFLSEREWRLLVVEGGGSKRFHRIEGTGTDAGWWFRPKLGHELQVIILPSNYFLKIAMNCDLIRKQLSGNSKQPVQLISAQALQKL